MAAQPASPVPTISPAEMQILISRSGLVLNPGQMADLVLAWRQVAGLIATIPPGRKLADDMAIAFRLPPPDASGAAEARPSPQPARKAPAARAPAGKAPARKAAAAKTKAKAKTPARKATAKSAGKAAAKPRSPARPAASAKAKTAAKRKAPARGRATRGR